MTPTWPQDDYTFQGQLEPERWPHIWQGGINDSSEPNGPQALYMDYDVGEWRPYPPVLPFVDANGEVAPGVDQVRILDGRICLPSAQRELRPFTDPFLVDQYWYGLQYRSEISTGNPNDNYAGKAGNPGYPMGAGDVVSMRLESPDWMGRFAGGFINFPQLFISFFSDDRAGHDDPETGDWVETDPGTAQVSWELLVQRKTAGVHTETDNAAAGVVARLSWGAYSHLADGWNDQHWTGFMTDTFPFDVAATPYVRMRMATDTSMTFEKSADGVTWGRLYPSSVVDRSNPWSSDYEDLGTPETRDGVIDVPGVSNARLTLTNFAAGPTGNMAAPSQYNDPYRGARHWSILIDHLSITSSNNAPGLFLVRDGVWVAASPLVLQGLQDAAWVEATPSEM